MGKHSAKWFERPATYTSWSVDEARKDFLAAFAVAQITGDYLDAVALRMRGRTGSVVRRLSDLLHVRVPKKWW